MRFVLQGLEKETVISVQLQAGGTKDDICVATE
jgi:hypothetical protein